jgi:predicted PhzF superfamily epimerase YddE/YHI9
MLTVLQVGLRTSVVRVYTNTVCPTRYRTRHFFNNSNTNEDIATWPLPAHVMMSHFLHNEVNQLQISLQYPH